MTRQGNTDQRGIAHLLMLGLVVAVIAAISLVGWEVMHHKQTTTNNVPATTQAAGTRPTSNSVYMTCMTQRHDSSLCYFISTGTAQPIDKSAYKATLTSTQSGSNTELVYEQDGKGNNSLSTSGSSAGSQLNDVTVNGVLYVQNGSEWIKYPTSADQPATQDPASDLSFMNTLTNITFTKIGSEVCGDLTCLQYQYTDSSSPDTTNYLWFDTHDYLLRQWSSSDPSSGTADMKLSYQAVTINVPSPAVDFSPTTH